MKGYPYRVECFSRVLGTWYFVKNARGLREAMEDAKYARESRDEAARVVRQ